MSWRKPVWVAGAVGAIWALAACDGGQPALPDVDAAATDASSPSDAGAADAPASRPAPTGAPLPPGVRPARRILDRSSTLTGGGEGSCSHQLPASGSGDRWCVFMRPGASAQTELWVMNVSHAATTVPACDGSSADCRRLTGNVWTGGGLNGPFQPYANRFFGDTLVFYADALSGAMEVHRGPAFAWRPGWVQARRISSDAALECWGDRHALVAHCVEDLAGDPVRPDSFELRAGVIADRDGIVLPSLGRIVPRTPAGDPAWQAGFSPSGDAFAISSPDDASHVESLRAVATAQIGQMPPAASIPGAHAWQIGNDGKRIFFLRQMTPDATALWVADFPSGANPAQLDPSVDSFFLLGGPGVDRGVGFVSHLGPDRGAFRLGADPAAPGATRTIFTTDNGLDAFVLSGDQRFTAWRNQDFLVTLVQHDNLKSCVLNLDPGHAAYSMAFLEHAGLVFWAESDGGDRDRRNGYFAAPTGCQGKQRFAQSVYFLFPIGDRGLVFADEVDDSTQRTTLKYAALGSNNQWPTTGPVRVHDDIDGTSVLFVGSDPLLLLFNVSVGAPDQQGTYLFGPVPF